jgi:hypothetical protein
MKCVSSFFLEARALIYFNRRHACGENPSKLSFFLISHVLVKHEFEVVYTVTRVWTLSGLSDKRAFYGPSLSPPFHDNIHRYDTARQIKEQQDAYCTRALAGEWENLGEFPDNLQWEALVDVLRGRVKVCFNISYFVRGHTNISLLEIRFTHIAMRRLI